MQDAERGTESRGRQGKPLAEQGLDSQKVVSVASVGSRAAEGAAAISTQQKVYPRLVAIETFRRGLMRQGVSPG